MTGVLCIPGSVFRVSNERARMLLEAERPREALTELRASLSEDPNNAETLRLLGQALLLADRGPQGAKDAIAAAQQSLASDPDNSFAWRILSVAYTRLGSHDASRDAARTGLRLDPAEWRNHTAVAHADASAKAVGNDTLAAVSAAIRLAPNEPETHFAAGRVAGAQNKRKVAAQHYSRALELDPQHPGSRNNLAVIRMAQGDTGAAAAGFVGLLASDPNSRLALFNLRVAARRSIRIVNVILWFALIFATSGLGVQSYTPTRGIAIGVTVLAVGCIVGYFLWIRRKAGAYFGRFVRSIPRTDRLLAVWALVLAASVVALVIALFVPVGVAVIVYAVLRIVLFASMVAMFATSYLLKPPPPG
jgi:cytochrome c-type biogenesis protein CcmH/NrfG